MNFLVFSTMEASLCSGFESSHAGDETVVFDFKPDNVEKYTSFGRAATSPLFKVGNGYACMKVHSYPCGTALHGKCIAAYLHYVPNTLWSEKWKLADVKLSITALNTTEEKSIVKTDTHTFKAHSQNWAWQIENFNHMWTNCLFNNV